METWKEVHGVLIPGGDPCYRCPRCGYEHVYGIECGRRLESCPDCGTKLRYPYDEHGREDEDED